MRRKSKQDEVIRKQVANRLGGKKALCASATFLTVLVASAFPFQISLALTSGPQQPEFRGFSVLGTEGYVNHFTGDLNYDIPLFTLPGPNGSYEFLLGYNSNVTMEQESSWVGLGWTLNVGAINRDVRGLPDEFKPVDSQPGKGDTLHVRHDRESSYTYGLGVGAGAEIVGFDSGLVGIGLDARIEFFYNNELGFGFTRTFNPVLQLNASGIKGSVGLSSTLNSQQGVQVGASASLSLTDKFSVNSGASTDSMEGLKSLTFQSSYEYDTERKKSIDGSFDVIDFLGYARPVSFPSVGTETTGTHFRGALKAGGEIYTVHPNVSGHGFYSKQHLKNTNEIQYDPYGFMNYDMVPLSSSLLEEEKFVMDFTREKDGAIHDNSLNLSIPITTPDSFKVAAHGLNGTFRAYRSDIPLLADRKVVSDLIGGTVAIEVGVGNIAHIGGTGEVNGSITTTGRWNFPGAESFLEEIDSVNNDEDSMVDKVSFRFIGEPNNHEWHKGVTLNTLHKVSSDAPPSDDAFDPIAPDLKTGTGFVLESLLSGSVPDQFPAFHLLEQDHFHSSGGTVPIKNDMLQRTNVPQSGRVIQAFTNEQLHKFINSDGTANSELESLGQFPNAAEYCRKHGVQGCNRNYLEDHHIGGFQITHTDGTRYIFGLPVYNLEHAEYEFSVNREQFLSDSECRIVTNEYKNYDDFEIAKELASENQNSIKYSEKFYRSRRLSSYPVSYLLTAVLGPEYVDSDGLPGISDGDVGYWVKFNYQKHSKDYRWRTPFKGARFSRGYDNAPLVANSDLAERNYDKATVSVGERQLYYLESAETSSHIAKFTIDDTRLDGLDANKQSSSSWRLKQIKLSRKPDTEPEYLLKTLDFHHDYSLAEGVPNTSANSDEESGKLTLRKLVVKDENSNRGELHPYLFNYSSENPEYSFANLGHWGYFQNNAETIADCKTQAYLGEPKPSNQNEASANQGASAWLLTDITEPGGRKIQITYESDDYAIVHNKQASTLVGVNRLESNDQNATTGDNFISENSKIYFNIENSHARPTIGEQEIKDWIEKYYVPDSKQVYFRIRVELRSDEYEIIRGYANATDWGIENDQGFIVLADVDGYHPFMHAAYQHLRIKQPELVAPQQAALQSSGDAIVEVAKIVLLGDFIAGALPLVTGGIYSEWRLRGWGNRLDLKNSFIRLKDGDQRKYGGGARVQEISFSDEWKKSTNGEEPSHNYGWTYEYTIKDDDYDVLKDGASSGVATFEPITAREENPMVRAKPFAEKVWLASDLNLFSEEPINEHYYPSPSVGYQRVLKYPISNNTVEDPINSSVPQTAGPVEYQFYTSRQFPVRVMETKMDKKQFSPFTLPIPFIGSISLDSMAATQGYSVVTNNMHGQPRSVKYFENTDKYNSTSEQFVVSPQPVSSTEYIYKQQSNIAGYPMELDNFVATVQDGENLKHATLGIDMELFADTRSNTTIFANIGGALNVDVSQYGPATIPIPSGMPRLDVAVTEAKTAVVNKVIHQTGILEEVIESRGTASTVIANHAFDPVTGQPLITSRENDFGNPVYTYNRPARWDFPGLSSSALSAGLTEKHPVAETADQEYRVTLSGKFIACKSYVGETWPCINVGDELAVLANGETGYGVITSVTEENFNFRLLGSIPGNVTEATLTVVRSGARNKLQASSETIVSLKHPIEDATTHSCTVEVTEPCQAEDEEQDIKVPHPAMLILFDMLSLNWASLVEGKIIPGSKSIEADISIDNDVVVLVGSIGGASTGSCNMGFAVSSKDLLTLDQFTTITDVAYSPEPSFSLSEFLPLTYTGLNVDFTSGSTTVNTFMVSDCDILWAETTTITVPGECPVTQELEYRKIPQTISALATTFEHNWSHTLDDLHTAPNVEFSTIAGRSGYLNGTEGLWRPHSVYDYLDTRQLSEPVNLKVDGTFELHTFEHSMTERERQQCSEKWALNHRVTRYSPSGFSIEEQDILNTYTSALYNNTNMVPVAVAQNAKNSEIGFQGFEELHVNSTVNTSSPNNGNIDFRFSQIPTESESVLRVGLFRRGLNYSFSNGVSKIYNESTQRRLGKRLARDGVRVILPNGCQHNVDRVYVDGSFRLSDQPIGLCPEGFPELRDSRLEQYDDIEIRFDDIGPDSSDPAPPSGSAFVSSIKAHTGKKSLKIGNKVDFRQSNLELDTTKKYYLSAWVSLESSNQAETFASAADAIAKTGIEIRFKDENGIELYSAFIEPSGPVIEGWQRLEGEFGVPDYDQFTLVLNAGDREGPDSMAFFDDIRIAPVTSLINTHVYDHSTFRLSASLDDNNFATLYSYDAEGDLYLIRKETERGILTVQENRTHLMEVSSDAQQP